MNAQQVIEKLGLEAHPEGGWYKRTFCDENGVGDRPQATAIYFLLEADKASRWHKLDVTELWHFYAGAPLELSMSPDGKWLEMLVLGPNILGGEMPQIVVPKGNWQSAQSTGDWTLVGCTLSPGFEFSGFEMAPEGWYPGA